MASEECQICADTFTTQRRKPVECPHCGFKCCVECVKRYILGDNDPMCMNPKCRAILSDEFMYDTFPKTFITNEFRKHMGTVMLEREKGLMQATMPNVESVIRVDEAKEHMVHLKQKMKELQNEIDEQHNVIYRAANGIHIDKSERKSSSVFLKKCQVDGCRGYLNSAYNCELCKTSACSRCFELKEEGHVCDEDVVKTAELLRNDTKSCPNCSEMIHKTEGCNQMYCVSCHTGFDWVSGKIVTGVLHNPHYFEYQRMNGHVARAAGDILCGGLPNMLDIRYKISTIVWDDDKLAYDLSIKLQKAYEGWIQGINHLRHHELPEYNTETTTFALNLESRIDYMRNKITEDQFKTAIIRKKIKNDKKRDLGHVFTTLCTLLEEQMRITVSSETSTIYSEFIGILQQCIEIVKYVNSCFQTLANRYKSSMPNITVPKHFNGYTERSGDYYSNYLRVSKVATKPIKQPKVQKVKKQPLKATLVFD